MNHGRTQGGGGAAGLQPRQTFQNRNLKNTDFVDMMILEVLRDCLSDEISH